MSNEPPPPYPGGPGAPMGPPGGYGPPPPVAPGGYGTGYGMETKEGMPPPGKDIVQLLMTRKNRDGQDKFASRVGNKSGKVTW